MRSARTSAATALRSPCASPDRRLTAQAVRDAGSRRQFAHPGRAPRGIVGGVTGLPRTRGPLIALLEARALRLRRRDGQTFLVEPAIAAAIVEGAGVCRDDAVVEIGPGAGALTVPLLARAGRVTAVEIDRGFADLLAEHLGEDPRFRIVHGDALGGPEGLNPELVEALADPRTFGCTRTLVVANLPYSVGTEIVVRLLARDPPPDEITVMLQAEVIERMTAAVATEHYGPLAVLLALTARTRVVRRVGRSAFFPRPAVESIVVKIEPDKERCASSEVRSAAALARRAFLHRRKQLAKTLDGAVDRETIVRAGLDPASRPEAVSPEGWLQLARAAV